MEGDVQSPGYAPRIVRAMTWPRISVALATAVLLSLGTLASAGLYGFLSTGQMVLAWMEHLAELAVLAIALLVAYALIDEALPRRLAMRVVLLCVLLFAVAGVLAVLLHAYYARGFAHLPPGLRLLSDAVHWGLPAVVLALTADYHQRSISTDEAALTAELNRAHQAEAEAQQRLSLLQAQIEPHFLFNILGNLRRLYRTDPGQGADAMASLMLYLRTAMTSLRSAQSTLGEELELVCAYLELHRIRMGARLVFEVHGGNIPKDTPFPPMLAVTLVENAVRHGIEPASGGRIVVAAAMQGDLLKLTVSDDGVGFGGAPGSGTGVGLANVRRQLASRHGGRARLVLSGAEPRGACACIEVPVGVQEVC